MKAKKSWKEKLLDSHGLPAVEPIKPEHEKRWGKGTMAIPSPLEVDELMKKVPKGKVATINNIRIKLAQKHHATIACPITTGIFAWIAANAAGEEADSGKKRITPFWRTLKEGGVLNEKYPGGIELQAVKLEEEGHHVMQKGKKWVVEKWQEACL